MAKKALLVGINYPGTKHALKGCINDVVAVSEVLTRKYGFATKDKRMLTDSSATTANIRDRLRWLVNGARPGDTLYFHYSGHGTQIINTDYESDQEPDGLDEVIVPIDMDWRNNVIRDDEFKAIFDTVPAGVNVTVVLDCCHSGGGLDHSYQYQPVVPSISRDPLSPNAARLLPMPADIANRGVGLDLPVRPRVIQTRDTESGALLISGCRSNQTSADAWIHNKYMGACTYFMLDVLKVSQYSVTYKTLVDMMNTQLAKYNYEQRPELNGNAMLFGRTFLY